jgi:hypothetical protein
MGSLYYNARLWLHDYPKEMQAVVPPHTPQEKRDLRIFSTLFFGVLIAFTVYSLAQFRATYGSSFLMTYAHIAIVFHIFNLVDALILDYLILTLMKPKFAILPGTEGMLYLYNNPRMHIGNYLKGFILITIASLPIAFIASL